MQVNATSMMAHTDWLATNANNIANVNTQDYNSIETTLQSENNSVSAVSSLSESGTDLASDLTEQIPIEGGFNAQVKAIKTQEEMIGSLLDMLA